MVDLTHTFEGNDSTFNHYILPPCMEDSLESLRRTPIDSDDNASQSMLVYEKIASLVDFSQYYPQDKPFSSGGNHESIHSSSQHNPDYSFLGKYAVFSLNVTNQPEKIKLMIGICDEPVDEVDILSMPVIKGITKRKDLAYLLDQENFDAALFLSDGTHVCTYDKYIQSAQAHSLRSIMDSPSMASLREKLNKKTEDLRGLHSIVS